MLDHSKARIFPAAERSCMENTLFRRYCSLSPGVCYKEDNAAIGSLYVFTDDTLAAGAKMQFAVDTDSCVVLIPTVGAITYNDALGNETIVEAGEVQLVFLPRHTHFELANPYENNLVNFLQCWLKVPQVSSIKPQVISFQLDKNKNKLIHLTDQLMHDDGKEYTIKASMGKFDGRHEALVTLKSSDHAAFAFVVQGAFEVQYRLMETRDALAIWNTTDVDMEALSNEAIIFFLEFPLESTFR